MTKTAASSNATSAKAASEAPQEKPAPAKAEQSKAETKDDSNKPVAAKPSIAAPAPPAKTPPANAPSAPARKTGGNSGPPLRRFAMQMQARPRRRHWALLISFLLLVVIPAAIANIYLHVRAADQYASNLAFTIQSDDGGVVTGLEAIFAGATGGTSADDTEVLYGFIQSQSLVATLDEQLNLRELFNKPEDDWWFRLGDDLSIEALVDYWEGMCRVSFGAGIIEVEVRAFSPEDAQNIAQAVLVESTRQINKMSEEAREDAVRDSREFLEEKEQALRDARIALSEFRDADQRVNPGMELEGAMSRISLLEAQLTEERLKLDELREFAPPGDSRVGAAQRRTASLEALIAEERDKLASATGSGDTLSRSVSRFEELTVDKEIAQEAYTVALASFEGAKADARRKHRYLSAHIAPTLAETPQYPERYILGALATAFLFMGWVVLVMIAYNVRDRR